MLEDAGVKVVRLPARSPDLNAFTERFVRSVKSECLCRVIPLGERHLRDLVSEYVGRYRPERNNQGLGNELIEPIPANTNSALIALWLGHESTETTMIYLHADMEIEERALARTNASGQVPDRFRASDALLAFLDTL